MHPSIIVNPADALARSAMQHAVLLAERGSGASAAIQHHTARGPLAVRAHRLLGLGPAGEAHRGRAEPALRRAFGGDVVSWSQRGNPWIAARSLAQPRDTLAGSTPSTRTWLLGSKRQSPAPGVVQE